MKQTYNSEFNITIYDDLPEATQISDNGDLCGDDRVRQLEQDRVEKKLLEAVKSGYGGISRKDGQIVDRRDQPDAIPIPKNKQLGAPEPKEVLIQNG